MEVGVRTSEPGRFPDGSTKFCKVRWRLGNLLWRPEPFTALTKATLTGGGTSWTRSWCSWRCANLSAALETEITIFGAQLFFLLRLGFHLRKVEYTDRDAGLGYNSLSPKGGSKRGIRPTNHLSHVKSLNYVFPQILFGSPLGDGEENRFETVRLATKAKRKEGNGKERERDAKTAETADRTTIPRYDQAIFLLNTGEKGAKDAQTFQVCGKDARNGGSRVNEFGVLPTAWRRFTYLKRTEALAEPTHVASLTRRLGRGCSCCDTACLCCATDVNAMLFRDTGIERMQCM